MTATKDDKQQKDLTGKERFTWNVITSWASYLIILIPGFIMPRLISDYQGSAALGVWDFCWAFVAYLRISGFGVGSSISRYVAKHRAEQDVEAIRSVVSTVMLIQMIVAIIVCIITVVLAYWLPVKFADSLGEYASESKWVILLLGGSLVLYFAFDSFRGVITGHHRWDIHNAIIAGTHGSSFVLMLLALVMGGGLFELSIAYFSVAFISELVRVYWGFKVCPDLKLHPSYISWKRAKKMMSFGVKTVLIDMPSLIIVQSTSILVMGGLGAPLLAVLMRPISLIRHVGTFVSKYAFVLTPMAGSIQARNNDEELRSFLLETAQYSVAFTLPLILFFVVFGDRVLYIWMGEGYAEWTLMAVLAMGYFLPISQNSVVRVLAGLNAHGKAALLSMVVAAVTYIFGAFYVEYIGWTLINAAILVAVSLTASQGVTIPIYACYRLKIPYLTYLKRVFVAPVLCCFIYFLLMLTIRIGLEDQPDLAMLLGGGAGGLVILPLYWKWIASSAFKEKLSGKIREQLGKA